LIWSMRPADGKEATYQLQHNFDPQFVNFDLVVDGKKVSSARLDQLQIADGVKQVQLTGAIHAVEFLPVGEGPHPAVLVLGGSEGGTPMGKAAWLASHGYVALALPYFRSAGLPARLENIPLEYFGEAISWLLTQPNVIPDEIGVMGTSRGGELALQLGAIYSQIHAVVAYVPANVRYPACCGPVVSGQPAWTWRGRGLVFASPRPNSPSLNPQAEIEVEKTNGPILMIAGDDDGVWNSKEMVAEAAARLKRHHFTFSVESYSYANAGHRAGSAVIIPTWAGTVTHPLSGASVQFGGTPEGNALSSADAGPKVLEFLKRSLPQKQGLVSSR
jgi:dienelactone hydrolase